LYAHGLADKPEVVALNKVDALDVDTLAERRAALEQACGKQVWLLSGVSGEGLQDLLRHLRQRLAQHEEEE
jgi:GTP-binding protein